MSEPHRIRLRGPWELEPLVRDVPGDDGSYRHDTRDLAAGGRVEVPSDWGAVLGADFLGSARYTRRFNCPTNLGTDDRVWLAFEGVDHKAAVHLNGRQVGHAHGYRATSWIEITGALEPHNVLAVDVSLSPAVFGDQALRPGRAGLSGGLIGEVRLEIRRDAPPM